FPESVEIAVAQPREANVIGAVIARGATPRQGIAVGVAKHLCGLCRACEISFAASLAPASHWIPMPRLDCEFRVLTIGNWLPARGQSLVQRGLQQIFVDRLYCNAVHARTQSFPRNEMVGGMRSVDLDGLR